MADWNPIRGVVNQALRSTLEKYVSNIDFDSLGVGGGAIVLRDLELRQESFPSRNGFHLARGFVKELRVSIPWTQLLSSPVQIEIRTCEVVFVQEDEYETGGGGGVSVVVAEADSDAANNKGWMSDMIRTIMANATIDLTNLVVKVERHPGLVLAISLKSASLCTCDAATWEKRFQRPTEPFGELFKLVEIGGLTVNVERRRQAAVGSSPRTPPRHSSSSSSSSFEFPMLSRTDARVRICLRLTPGSSASATGESAASQDANSTSMSLLMPSRFLQRVASSGGVRSPSPAAAAASAAVANESPASSTKLQPHADPFFDAINDPPRAKDCQFVCGVDLWVERLDLSVSEKQLEILLELGRPPVAITPPPPPVKEEEVVAAPPALPTPPSPVEKSTGEETAGWAAWAWQTVAPVYDDENGTSAPRQPAPPPPVSVFVTKTLSIAGVRVDRCTLRLMLHTAPRETVAAAALSPVTPRAATKRMLAVQTPSGVVYVEGDDDDDNSASSTSRKTPTTASTHHHQHQHQHVVAFAEISLRTLSLQCSKITAQPLVLAVDVDSVEVTRWHQDYSQLPVDGGLVRHDVWFSWFGRGEAADGQRVSLPHPHSNWSYWAHPPPPSASLPAIRARVSAGGGGGDVLVDVALAPVSLTVDSLLLRGCACFFPVLSTSSPPAPASPAPPSTSTNVELLVTLSSLQLALATSDAVVKLDVQRVQCGVAKRASVVCGGHFGVDSVEASVRSTAAASSSSVSAKRVVQVQDVRAQLVRAGHGSLQLASASAGMSLTQAAQLQNVAATLVDAACGASSALLPRAPLVRLDGTVLDLMVLEVGLRRGLGVTVQGDEARFQLRHAELCTVAGQTLTVFASSAPSASTSHDDGDDGDDAGFVDVLVRLARGDDGSFLASRLRAAEAIQLKLGQWELDWDGVVRTATWASHLVLPPHPRRNTTTSSTTTTGDSAASLPPAWPALTVDAEPGTVILSSSSAACSDKTTSEIRFPLVAVRTVHNGDGHGQVEYRCNVDGARIIILDHVVLANGKLTLECSPRSKKLFARVFPLLVDFGAPHVDFVLANVNALAAVLPSSSASSSSPVVPVNPPPPRAWSAAELVVDDVHLVVRTRNDDDDDEQEEQNFSSISDVPRTVSLRASKFSLTVNFATGAATPDFTAQLADLVVREEDWSMFAFNKTEQQPSSYSSIAVSRQQDGSGGGDVRVSVRVAAFAASVRGGAVRAPLAVLSPLLQRMTRSRRPREAAATTPPGRVRLAVDLEPCELTVPLSSTRASRRPVEAVCIRLAHGVHWNDESAGGAESTAAVVVVVDFGWGVHGDDEGTFTPSETWARLEPVVRVDDTGGVAITCPSLSITLGTCTDVSRIHACALVLASKSRLEKRRPLASSSSAAPPRTTTPTPRQQRAFSLAVNLVALRIAERDLLDAALHGLVIKTGGPSPHVQFDSLTVRAVGGRHVLSSHDFVSTAHVCELSRSGPIHVALEPRVLEELFVALCVPLTRLDTSLLPRRTGGRRKKNAQQNAINAAMNAASPVSFKILLPRLRVSLHSSGNGNGNSAACVVVQMQQGIASVLSSSTADLTLAGLEVVLLPRGGGGGGGTAVVVLPLVPKTDIRLFGETRTHQFSLDLADVKLNLGVENVAIVLAVAQAFRSLEQRRFVPFARHFKMPTLPTDEELLLLQDDEEAAEEELALPEDMELTRGAFQLLLDNEAGEEEIDPAAGQLVFANNNSNSTGRLDDNDGFKLRMPHGERRVSMLQVASQVVLERSLRSAFAGRELVCEFLAWDALRERWASLAKFDVMATCSSSGDATDDDDDGAEEDDDADHSPSSSRGGGGRPFASAFASWMEEEMKPMKPSAAAAAAQAQSRGPQSIKTLGEAAELYWVRWSLAAGGGEKKKKSTNSLQRVAVSNALAQALTLRCVRVPLPLVDMKVSMSSAAVHVLHHCVRSTGSSGTSLMMAASELFVVRAPLSKLRFVFRSPRDWLLLMEHVLAVDVNRVADFTRSTVVKDFSVTCELAPKLVDLHLGTLDVDLQPESLQVLSHAIRGLALDFSPAHLRRRVAEVDEEEEDQVLLPQQRATSSRSACSCARMTFVNRTGRSVWFKREEESEPPMMLLQHGEEDAEGDSLAYSWTCCTCDLHAGAPLPLPPRVLRFSFEVDSTEQDDNKRWWSEAVDMDVMGLSRVGVRLPSTYGRRQQRESELWVSVQLGEPTIQTIVTLHASDAVVNRCQFPIDVLPLLPPPPTTSGEDAPHAASDGGDAVAVAASHTTRVMLSREQRAGWMFRVCGGAWSKLVARPSSAAAAAPVLVELPASPRPLFVWAKFTSSEADEDEDAGNGAGWKEVELYPSYWLDNRTSVDLVVRVRPEHRWESLQYALQSVTLSTTPPGPAGTWLALAPSASSTNGPPLVHASYSPAPEEQPAGTVAAASDKQQGAALAHELLNSVMASPKAATTASSSSPLHALHHFSSSLDMSSVLADGSSAEFTVRAGTRLGLAVDPRESHAVLVGLQHHQPLRLHPNMLSSTGSWQRCLGISPTSSVVALAQGVQANSPLQRSVTVSLSPLFRVRNDTECELLWAAVSLAEWRAGSAGGGGNHPPPQPHDIHALRPGEQIDVHADGCDALRLAAVWKSGSSSSSTGDADDEDDVEYASLLWSDAFGVAAEADVNLAIPLTTTTTITSHHPYRRHQYHLQMCASTSREDRVCALASRVTLCNYTGEALRWRWEEDNDYGQLHVLQDQAQVSVPSCVLDGGGDGGLCAVVQLFGGDGFVEGKGHTLLLDPVAEPDATAVFVLGQRLLVCRHVATGATGAASPYFVLTADAQPRFMLENTSSTHAVEVVSCSAGKVGGQCGSKLVLGPRARVPFDWRCFDHLVKWTRGRRGSAEDDQEATVEVVVAQNLKLASATAVGAERFFANETDEKMRLRMTTPPVGAAASAATAEWSFWHPAEERGWSQTVSTASSTVYTFHHGRVLVSAPQEDGVKLLTIAYTGGVSGASSPAAVESPPLPLPPVGKAMVALFRLDSLLVKFSTRQTEVVLLGVQRVSASVDVGGGGGVQPPPPPPHGSTTRWCEVDARVHHIQLESLLPNSEFPVVATFTNNTNANDKDNHDAVAVHTTFALQRRPPVFFKDIVVQLAPLAVNVEDDTFKQWIVVFAPLLASMAADWKLLSSTSTSTSSRRRPPPPPPAPLFVCETLELGAVQCVLTLKTSQRVFVGIDRTPLSLWPVSATNVRCTVKHATNELAANYLADLLLNSPAVLGSLEMLGNPTGFLRSLAHGVHDLVAIPFKELKRGWGPRGLLRGIALGWLGLLSHVADGALNSVSGFSASLARNLALTLERRQQASTTRVQAVLRGLAGVVVRPAENAANLVSRTTRRMSVRLRPQAARLAASPPLSPPLVVMAAAGHSASAAACCSSSHVDIERMLAWNVLGGGEQDGGGGTEVRRTDVCEFDVDDDGGSGDRTSVRVRVILTNLGVCALRGECLLHGQPHSRDWMFSYAWRDVVSVQESLSKLNLAVLMVKEEQHQQRRLLRFTFENEAQRRAFVLDALAGIEQQGEA